MKVNRFGLTPQQENFANLLATGTMTQSDAYREAYPRSRKWQKAKAVHEAASSLAAHQKVAQRVADLRQAAADRAILRAEDVLEETRRIALSTPAGIMDEQGRIKLPHELDAATAAAISSFEIDDVGRIKYRFWDKNASLERASRILGLYKRDNEQKTDALAALLAELSGTVITPAPGAAQPDADGGAFGVAED